MLPTNEDASTWSSYKLGTTNLGQLKQVHETQLYHDMKAIIRDANNHQAEPAKVSRKFHRVSGQSQSNKENHTNGVEDLAKRVATMAVEQREHARSDKELTRDTGEQGVCADPLNIYKPARGPSGYHVNPSKDARHQGRKAGSAQPFATSSQQQCQSRDDWNKLRLHALASRVKDERDVMKAKAHGLNPQSQHDSRRAAMDYDRVRRAVEQQKKSAQPAVSSRASSMKKPATGLSSEAKSAGVIQAELEAMIRSFDSQESSEVDDEHDGVGALVKGERATRTSKGGKKNRPAKDIDPDSRLLATTVCHGMKSRKATLTSGNNKNNNNKASEEDKAKKKKGANKKKVPKKDRSKTTKEDQRAFLARISTSVARRRGDQNDIEILSARLCPTTAGGHSPRRHRVAKAVTRRKRATGLKGKRPRFSSILKTKRSVIGGINKRAPDIPCVRKRVRFTLSDNENDSADSQQLLPLSRTTTTYAGSSGNLGHFQAISSSPLTPPRAHLNLASTVAMQISPFKPGLTAMQISPFKPRVEETAGREEPRMAGNFGGAFASVKPPTLTPWVQDVSVHDVSPLGTQENGFFDSATDITRSSDPVVWKANFEF